MFIVTNPLNQDLRWEDFFRDAQTQVNEEELDEIFLSNNDAVEDSAPSVRKPSAPGPSESLVSERNRQSLVAAEMDTESTSIFALPSSSRSDTDETTEFTRTLCGNQSTVNEVVSCLPPKSASLLTPMSTITQIHNHETSKTTSLLTSSEENVDLTNMHKHPVELSSLLVRKNRQSSFVPLTENLPLTACQCSLLHVDTNVASSERLKGNIGSEMRKSIVAGFEKAGTPLNTTENTESLMSVSEKVETIVDDSEKMDTNAVVSEKMDTVVNGSEDTIASTSEKMDTIVNGSENMDTIMTGSIETNADVSEKMDTTVSGSDKHHTVVHGSAKMDNILNGLKNVDTVVNGSEKVCLSEEFLKKIDSNISSEKMEVIASNSEKMDTILSDLERLDKTKDGSALMEAIKNREKTKTIVSGSKVADITVSGSEKMDTIANVSEKRNSIVNDTENTNRILNDSEKNEIMSTSTGKRESIAINSKNKKSSVAGSEIENIVTDIKKTKNIETAFEKTENNMSASDENKAIETSSKKIMESNVSSVSSLSENDAQLEDSKSTIAIGKRRRKSRQEGTNKKRRMSLFDKIGQESVSVDAEARSSTRNKSVDSAMGLSPGPSKKLRGARRSSL